jgi:hypothetical protein
MFRSSPSTKEAKGIERHQVIIPVDPVTQWTTDRNFAFPPALTMDHVVKTTDSHPRFKQIREVPTVGSSLYHLLSQYNPWLDCEMTREKRVYLKPRIGDFSCAVNTSTSYSVVDPRSVVPNFFRNDTIIDIVNLYLWPLLYSRADEVVSCATFSDWRRLFSKTINLAFPDYDYWVSVAAVGSVSPTTMSTFVPISDQQRTARILKYMTPARVLYLLTTRANFWPYGPSSPPQQQPRSRVAGIFGLCSIKPRIKEYSEKTEIQWLVSSEFLRKMKRVHMYFTSSQSEPCVSMNDTDSDE